MFHQWVHKSVAIKRMKFDGDRTMSTAVILIVCVLVNVAPLTPEASQFQHLKTLKVHMDLVSIPGAAHGNVNHAKKMSHFLFPEGTIPSFNDYFHINMFRDSWHTCRV